MTKRQRISIYKQALEEYYVYGWDPEESAPFLCSKLAILCHKMMYDPREFLPEIAALYPNKNYSDGTTKWWAEGDISSRMNALCIAIALAELNIPLP